MFTKESYCCKKLIILALLILQLAACANQPAGSPQIDIEPAQVSVSSATPEHATAFDEPIKPTVQTVASYQQEAAKLQAQMAKALKEHAAPEDIAIMKRAAEALAAAMPAPGIPVGEVAPNFTLPNAWNQPISLKEALKSGPVVLVFYRGSWCPYCNLHLRSLQSIESQLKAHGAQLIAITPQKPDESKAELEKSGHPFEILSDLDYSVTQSYNLYFEMSDELLALYKKFDIDLEAVNGAGRTALPVPGTFVIDQQGIVRAMEAETDYKQRMEPAAIVKALKSIAGRCDDKRKGEHRCPLHGHEKKCHGKKVCKGKQVCDGKERCKGKAKGKCKGKEMCDGKKKCHGKDREKCHYKNGHHHKDEHHHHH